MELDHGVLFFLVEMAGTVAFAVSGAMLAVQRGLDLFGVVFLGAATAIGGGVLRDLLLGQVPPLAFLNGIYLLVSAAASLAVFAAALVNRRRGRGDLPSYSELLNVFDAAGLGIFSVIGVQHTVAAGFGENVFLCVFLGMTTGVGGGALRDVLSGATPAILRKHVYALASVAGALCYYLLRGPFPGGSIAVSVLLVVVLRVLASRYRWTLPRVPPRDP